jgi:phosphoglycerol transferase MdoB-like AlkP superfamily enzyme
MGSLGQNPIPEFRFMSDAEAHAIVYGDDPLRPLPQKPNIVLIIVESLGREFLGYSNGSTLTPFLDDLSGRSLNFDYCYANGTRSKEMISSIFCGIPSWLEDDYISSMYAGNKLENAFAKFAKCGYSTGFFHGGENGTMDFQSFLAATGPKTYYGRDQYPDQADYDGAWGIYDEPYLQYFASCLDTMRKPFFTSVFTLSSHEPYSIPEKYKGRFSDTGLPIYKTIQYTDLALRNFFAYAQKQPWFDNTIFVITGDHTSSGKHDYFYSTSGHYEVPLLIYGGPVTRRFLLEDRVEKPLDPAPETKTVAQTDIVPTLLALSGCPDRRMGIGHNIFSAYKGFSFNRQNGLWYIIEYPFALGIDEYGVVKDFHRRYRNKTVQEQLPRNHPEREWMEKTLKAHLQLFSKSLRTNSLD